MRGMSNKPINVSPKDMGNILFAVIVIAIMLILAAIGAGVI